MKTKDIAQKYDIDQKKFEEYLRQVGANFKYGFTSSVILEDDIEGHVRKYKEEQARQEEIEKEEKAKQEAAEKEALERTRREEEERQQAEAAKQRALSNMLITSGFSFDGYKIKKYSGYISGDDVISIDRGTSGIFSDPTNVGESLTKALVQIRRQAIKELKEAAYNLGCNAVIGVDFDYITLDPETANSRGGTTYLPYVFCVTANGNAVIIEKSED